MSSCPVRDLPVNTRPVLRITGGVPRSSVENYTFSYERGKMESWRMESWRIESWRIESWRLEN